MQTVRSSLHKNLHKHTGKENPETNLQCLAWDITFVGFATYKNMRWDITLVQKVKKAFGDMTESISCAGQSKCNMLEDA